MSEHRNYETILYREEGPVGILTLNRPHDGNMFNATMCIEVRDCIELIRRETRTRVLVLTGAGDKFFCIGGHHDGARRHSPLPRCAAYVGNVRRH